MRAQVEHIHERFPHLIDERSFTSWAPHFHEFADAFDKAGIPIPNLIGFIDGKLWPVCRPGKYQHVLYSGHKRIHGLKTQGLVFPNGVCASRHSTLSPRAIFFGPDRCLCLPTVCQTVNGSRRIKGSAPTRR